MRAVLVALAGAMLASAPAAANDPAPKAPPPVYVPPAPPRAPGVPVQTEAGLALAQRLTVLVLPPDMMFEQNLATIPVVLDAEAKKNPDLEALLQQHPGLRTKLVETGQRELTRILTAGLPAMQAAMAEHYVRNLDEATLRTTVEFYESELGRKLIRVEYQSIDPAVLSDKGLADGETFTRSDVDQLYVGVGGRMIKALTPQERVKVTAFTLSPAGQKLFRLTNRTKDLSVKLLNDLIGPHRAEIEAAYAEAVAEYFSSTAAAN